MSHEISISYDVQCSAPAKIEDGEIVETGDKQMTIGAMSYYDCSCGFQSRNKERIIQHLESVGEI